MIEEVVVESDVENDFVVDVVDVVAGVRVDVVNEAVEVDYFDGYKMRLMLLSVLLLLPMMLTMVLLLLLMML